MTQTPNPSTSPNIVLIVLDAVRRDHLSAYGYWRQTTPYIDSLAASGVRFERAYATSCWTLPSHASLFTGLYPSQHGVDLDTGPLDGRHTTLAAWLGQHGYETVCLSCNGFVGGAGSRLRQGFQRSVDVEALRGSRRSLPAKVVRALHGRWRRYTRRDRGARQATDLACRWLRQRNPSQPFFLFLNYMECHLPYGLRSRERYHFLRTNERARADRVPQDPFAVMAGRQTLSTLDVDDLQALYDGGLRYLDAQVAQLDACLQESGQRENTLVVITADHGESFGEHGLFYHQYGLYEHLLAVPLIMRLPGGRLAGTVRTQPVQLVDVFPTVVEVVSETRPVERPTAGAGTSLLRETERHAVMAEYLVPNLRAFRRRFPELDLTRFAVGMRSIRQDRYKLIWRTDRGPELYDLWSDPGEENNRAASDPDRVGEMQAKLEACLGPWPGVERRDPAETDNEAMRDRLEALGYL